MTALDRLDNIHRRLVRLQWMVAANIVLTLIALYLTAAIDAGL